MPIILPDKKIVHKPLNPRIDFKNSLTRGLVFDVPLFESHGNVASDLISKRTGSITPAGGVWADTPYGSGLNFLGTGGGIVYTAPSLVNGLQRMSFETLFFCRSDGQGTSGRFLHKKNAAQGYFHIYVAGNNINFSVGYSTTSSLYFNGINIAYNTWYHMVLTYDFTNSANTPAFYINGIQDVSNTATPPSGSLIADDNNIYIGDRGDATRTFDGRIVYERLWNRILSPTEAASLSANPWQIYQEPLMRRPRIYIDAYPPATVTAETEQETSQIIIDKIVQGQIGGGATLTMDVPIPSFDAVLIVTGGSAIATGGAWQSVKFNGISLTKLVQAGVAGNSAEIWYLPFPPVGVYSLVITPTALFGQVYANAMVLLGVDKKSTSVVTSSVIDAASTSTVTANITPDAPNSVIIDAIATIDGVSVPVPDASQTQVFNPTSLNVNEYVLSTFKLSSNIINNMNYNLSIAVNAALVAVSFRPTNHPSLWFPNIDTRAIDDVVTANGLDSGITLSGTYGYKPAMFYLNSFFQTLGRSTRVPPPVLKTISYGYKPSMFYLNSYLHTIGRNIKPSNPVVSTSNSTLLLLGVG